MKKTVCVIGLGYVGLPLAVRSVEKGYKVLGLDMDRKKVEIINAGQSPIEEKFLEKNLPNYRFTASTEEKVINQADIILICVPTPVDEKFNPDLEPVIGATEMIVRNLKKGALVVLESTVNPGVSEEVVLPIFEKAGYKIGEDVFIAHCPERINPGDKKWNVTNIPRVIGSFDAKGLQMAKEFYASIINAPIRPMKSIREAEAVKIVENSFRDINIAFVNELARSFDKLDIDVKDVILGAATKPFAFMPHFPACGVGGHCIPVDPYYLIERAKKSGFDHKFLRLAREINNSMPEYTVELLEEALNQIGMPLKGAKIGVLGIAYKANVDDVRESPSIKIMQMLKAAETDFLSFDPHILGKSTAKSLKEILQHSDALILVTDHKEFVEIHPQILQENGIKVVIDGKNCLDKDKIKDLSIIYKGIGR